MYLYKRDGTPRLNMGDEVRSIFSSAPTKINTPVPICWMPAARGICPQKSLYDFTTETQDSAHLAAPAHPGSAELARHAPRRAPYGRQGPWWPPRALSPEPGGRLAGPRHSLGRATTYLAEKVAPGELLNHNISAARSIL